MHQNDALDLNFSKKFQDFLLKRLNIEYLHIKAFKFSWQWVWKLRRVDLVPSLDRLSGDQASRSVALSG